jgi:hypothetical protein
MDIRDLLQQEPRWTKGNIFDFFSELLRVHSDQVIPGEYLIHGFKFNHRRWYLPVHYGYCILVGKVVRSFHYIKGISLPAVMGRDICISEARIDPPCACGEGPQGPINNDKVMRVYDGDIPGVGGASGCNALSSPMEGNDYFYVTLSIRGGKTSRWFSMEKLIRHAGK